MRARQFRVIPAESGVKFPGWWVTILPPVTTAWILAIATAVGAEPRSQEPVEKPAPLFTVFVFASSTGEPKKDRELLRASDQVRKRIAARKSRFKTAAAREQAQIVVEVRAHTVEERLTIYASTGTMGGQVEGATRYAVTKQHFLEARVTLRGAEFTLRGIDTTKKGSLKGAATALAIELEKECEKRVGPEGAYRPS